MSAEPVEIKVGAPFPILSRASFPAPGIKALLDARNATLHLLAALDDATAAERDGFRHGTIRVGLANVTEHTAVWLYSIEGFCKWSDAPLQLGANGPDHRAWSVRDDPGPGRLLFFYLLRWPGLEVEVIRATSASSSFGTYLDRIMRQQEQHLPEYTDAAGARDADDIRRHETRHWVDRAAVKEIAGLPGTFGTPTVPEGMA